MGLHAEELDEPLQYKPRKQSKPSFMCLTATSTIWEDEEIRKSKTQIHVIVLHIPPIQ